MTKKTVLTIITMLTIAATSNATTIPSIPKPSSGGGGGSSSSIIPDVHLDNSLDLGGFSMYAHSTNSYPDARLHASTRVEQGWMDSYLFFAGLGGGLYRDYSDPTIIYGSVESNYNVVKYQENLHNLANQEVNSNQDLHINLFGMNVNVNSNARNSEEGFRNPFTNEWEWFTTQNIQVDHSIWIDNGEIFRQTIDPYLDWNDETNRLTARFAFGAQLYGNLADIQAITSNLEVVPQDVLAQFTTVPEPATMLLLGLGSTVLLRRRRRR